MKGAPIDELVYRHIFPPGNRLKPHWVPVDFSHFLDTYLIQEVRQEVVSFYGHLETIEAKYPGLDYTSPIHRRRLGRWPWHQRLFKAFDELRLTDWEIHTLTKWEGTKWAKERYETDQGVIIRDTTSDLVSNWVEPEDRSSSSGSATAVPSTYVNDDYRSELVSSDSELDEQELIEDGYDSYDGMDEDESDEDEDDQDDEDDGEEEEESDEEFVGNLERIAREGRSLAMRDLEARARAWVSAISRLESIAGSSARVSTQDPAHMALDEQLEQWIKHVLEISTEQIVRNGSRRQPVPPHVLARQRDLDHRTSDILNSTRQRRSASSRPRRGRGERLAPSNLHPQLSRSTHSATGNSNTHLASNTATTTTTPSPASTLTPTSIEAGAFSSNLTSPAARNGFLRDSMVPAFSRFGIPIIPPGGSGRSGAPGRRLRTGNGGGGGGGGMYSVYQQWRRNQPSPRLSLASSSPSDPANIGSLRMYQRYGYGTRFPHRLSWDSPSAPTPTPTTLTATTTTTATSTTGAGRSYGGRRHIRDSNMNVGGIAVVDPTRPRVINTGITTTITPTTTTTTTTTTTNNNSNSNDNNNTNNNNDNNDAVLPSSSPPSNSQ